MTEEKSATRGRIAFAVIAVALLLAGVAAGWLWQARSSEPARLATADREAVETVVREWMDAWNLGRSDWPHIAREMESFTEAFYDYANDPSDEHDKRLRETCAALDTVLEQEGTSISDQMAFRSQCAHGWWECVKPVPADLPGRKPRPTVPGLESGKAFWEAGCADFCR